MYEDGKHYDDCFVSTWHDDFTGETSASVMCPESIVRGCDSDSYYKRLVLSFTAGKGVVWLDAGLQFHPEETIPVKYRFDRDPAQSENWEHTENLAFSRTDREFNNFAAGLRTSEKLVFAVGDSSTVRIPLKGAALRNAFLRRAPSPPFTSMVSISLKGSAEAMKDFDKRCEQMQ